MGRKNGALAEEIILPKSLSPELLRNRISSVPGIHMDDFDCVYQALGATGVLPAICFPLRAIEGHLRCSEPILALEQRRRAVRDISVQIRLLGYVA